MIQKKRLVHTAGSHGEEGQHCVICGLYMAPPEGGFREGARVLVVGTPGTREAVFWVNLDFGTDTQNSPDCTNGDPS